MFKLAKYYVLLNLYQNAKRNIIIIFVSTILLVMSIYMFSDLIAMTDEKVGLMIAKWIAILLFLGVIIFNIVQIFKAVSVPFKKETRNKSADARKENIVTKEHLVSRSELIINKYRDSQ